MTTHAPSPLPTPDRLRRIASILEVCLDLDPLEREAYLERLGAVDPDLRRQVEAYLEPAPDLDATERVGAAGAASTSSSTGEPGERIGPYRIVEWLGAGGMGTVYLAERDDEAFHRRVAVKVLSFAFPSPEVLRRFRGERQILADFDHPNIARLYEGGTTPDDRPYLVMEYVEGPPLPVYCDEQHLSVPERVTLFRRVCAAVRYAHSRLVVHRDLKPSNVLVHSDGEPKLLDFGIAKLLDPESFPLTVEATRTGSGPLTPFYASPEQLRGEVITTASDVYSLGVLLYLTLTGTLPHAPNSASPFAILRQITGEEPALPSRKITSPDAERPGPVTERFGTSVPLVRQQLAGDLDNIVLKALQVDPGRRYGSVEQLDEDLRRHLEGLPVSAREGSLVYRATKFARRHKGPVGAAVGFAGMAGAFVTALARERDVAVAARQEAEEAQRRAEEAAAAEREVSRFLVDLFEAADPGSLSREQSLRDLVDRGTRQLSETSQSMSAWTRASMLNALGLIFRNIGDIPNALKFLEESHALYDISGASFSHSERTSNLVNLARGYVSAGRYDEARTVLSDAENLVEIAGVDQWDKAGDIWNLLGVICFKQGLYVDAITYYEKALDVQVGLRKPDARLVGRYSANLAGSLTRTGDARQAINMLIEVLYSLRGDETFSRVECLRTLNYCLAEVGAFEDALVVARHCFDLARANVSEWGGWTLGNDVYNLVIIYIGLNEINAAKELLAEARAMSESVSETSRERAEVVFSLAESILESKIGDLTRAKIALKKTKDALNKYGLNDSFMEGVIEGNEGYIKMQAGEYGLAKAILERSVDILERIQSPRLPALAMPCLGLAQFYDIEGDLKASTDFFQKGLAHAEATPHYWFTIEFVQAYASFLENQNRHDEAEALRRRHQELIDANPPPELPDWLFEEIEKAEET